MKFNPFITFVAAASLAALLFACTKYSTSSLAAGDFRVELHPIELDLNDPQRVEFDRLKLLGAFHLRSNDARFGGLSGMTIGNDGRFYAVVVPYLGRWRERPGPRVRAPVGLRKTAVVAARRCCPYPPTGTDT